MKVKKVFTLLIFAGILIFTVSCSNKEKNAYENDRVDRNLTEVDQTEQKEQKDMTADQWIEAANTKIGDAKNFNSSIKVEMEFQIEDQSYSSNISADISYFLNPTKFYALISNSENELRAEIYAKENNDMYDIYIFDGSQWIMQSAPKHEIEKYSVEGVMSLYMGDLSEFDVEKTETVNGVSAVKINGRLTGEQLKNALESYALISSYQNTLGTDALTSNLYDDMECVETSVWIDEETKLPVKLQMDLSSVFQKSIDTFAENYEEDSYGSIYVNKFELTIDNFNFDETEEFDVPDNLGEK